LQYQIQRGGEDQFPIKIKEKTVSA